MQAGRLTCYKPVPGKVLVDRRELEQCILSSAWHAGSDGPKPFDI